MSDSANDGSRPFLWSVGGATLGGNRMKTVLDLIGEFAVLNDAKVMWGGTLPRETESRWQELKDFYDLLMSQSGVGPRPVTRQFSARDVAEIVTSRERLRVPLESELIFKTGQEFHTAKGVNVSRGGVYLSSSFILPASSSLTVFLASSDVTDESFLEADGEVVWSTDAEAGALPPGMGVSFMKQEDPIEKHLDAMVIEALVRRLSGVDANCLAPEFLSKERVAL